MLSVGYLIPVYVCLLCVALQHVFTHQIQLAWKGPLVEGCSHQERPNLLEGCLLDNDNPYVEFLFHSATFYLKCL